MRHSLRLQLSASSVVAGLLFCGAANAAAPATTDSQGSQADAPPAEIVVTAQRRSELLQNVPITVTNLSQDQLEAGNVQSLANIVQLTPALRFDHQGAYTQPTIRGVGSALTVSSAGSNVGIYLDGFYAPAVRSLDTQLLNVQNIQVVKGPQGTLFGRNTTGGAILITTSKPSSEMSGVVDASYGSYNAQRYQGYFTAGLAGGVAFDVGGAFSKGDGYVHNIVTGSDKDGAYQNWSIRTGLKIDPSDNLSLLFRYEHQSVNDPTFVEYGAYVLNGQPLTLGAVMPGAIIATRPHEVAETETNYFYGKSDIFQLTASLDLGFGTLTSYTQYRRDSNQGLSNIAPGSANVIHVYVPLTNKTFTQEVLLTSKPGRRLQWTAGVFYFDFKDSLLSSLQRGTGALVPSAGSGSDTRTIAAYADVTYEAIPKLFLTAGLRYSHDEIRNAFYILGTGAPNYVPTLSSDRVTPRFVIRYAPTETSSVYASFSRGYKAPIYNLGPTSQAPVQPETISAYEVGYKFAGPKLSFDLAAFYYHYSNLQLTSLNQVNGVPNATVTNAATSRIYGLEGQVRYQIGRDFEVNIGAAYIDGKYKSFRNAPGFTPCFTLPACGAGYGQLLPTIVDASGKEMLRTPKFTLTAGLRYSIDFARGRLSLSSNLYYTSKFYFDPVGQLPQDHYATLGLRAEWTDPSSRFTIAVFGDNVTDTKYLSQLYANTPGAPLTWGQPATVGGEIRVKFR